MPKEIIDIFSFIGMGVVGGLVVILFAFLKRKADDFFSEIARKRRIKRKKLHKVKIPTYCFECIHWGGGKKTNYQHCPMAGWFTAETDYCSRAFKGKNDYEEE